MWIPRLLDKAFPKIAGKVFGIHSKTKKQAYYWSKYKRLGKLLLWHDSMYTEGSDMDAYSVIFFTGVVIGMVLGWLQSGLITCIG